MGTNSEIYFRSFCQEFICARGQPEERKKHGQKLIMVQNELGLSKKTVHKLFREEVSQYEDIRKIELLTHWGFLTDETSPSLS